VNNEIDANIEKTEENENHDTSTCYEDSQKKKIEEACRATMTVASHPAWIP